MENDKDNKAIEFDSLDKGLIDTIDSFYRLTQMPVSYYGKDANLIWESHNNKKMCSLCRAYEDKESRCKDNIRYSGDIAAQLGEPYIFLCKARLTLIVYPVIVNNEHLGSYITGPVVLGTVRSNVIEYILDRCNSKKQQADVLVKLNETKVYAPKMISAIANVFECCISSSLNSNPYYENIKNSFEKNQKINETLRQSKNMPEGQPSYPMDTEKELIDAVTSGDVYESIDLLHKYLEAVTLFNFGDLSLTKLDIIQMFGLLLRKIKDDAAIFSDVKDKYDFQLKKINRAANIAELSSTLSELIEQITKLFETSVYMGDIDVIKKTIGYVAKNYKDKITLKSISDDLHISTPYLSTLFKKEMDKTFSDYLSQFRIQKSEELLKESSLSITEIALVTGFEDQSYFNKVFKKITGMTPKQYRHKKY